MLATAQATMPPGHATAALILLAQQASRASQHARPCTTDPPDAPNNAASDDIVSKHADPS